MSLSNAERQRRFRMRRAGSGVRVLQVPVTAEVWELVRRCLAEAGAVEATEERTLALFLARGAVFSCNAGRGADKLRGPVRSLLGGAR